MRQGCSTRWLLSLVLASASALNAQATIYDRVILNGRVMDPESGLDAQRNIGIRGGKVAAIVMGALVGRDTIDASGLVVAPGFIDLHVHWNDDEGYRFAALDGVTTALELEMIAGARARGVDVTTEVYPYEAGSTDIRAAIFDPGWQGRLGITERDIMWSATGGTPNAGNVPGLPPNRAAPSSPS